MINQERQVWRLLSVVAAVFFLLGTMALKASPATSRDEQTAGYCGPAVVRSYLAALERAAPIRQLPTSGRLPFLPHGVSVHVIGGVEVRRGTIGFGFSDGDVDHPRRVNLSIKATLNKVTASGEISAVLGEKVEFVGTRQLGADHPNKQRFSVTGTPAYYRVDIGFRRKGGQTLGTYSQYFRVMRPKFKVRLETENEVARPGQKLHVRLANLGTEPIQASRELLVEGYEGGGWVLVDTVFVGNKPFRGKEFVYGGETGPCISYVLPESRDVSLYRFRDQITRHLKNGQTKTITTSVRVANSKS